MTKYKQAVVELITKHQKDFDEFAKVHALYMQDQTKWQAEFDRLGLPLKRLSEEAENRLCGKMEGSSLGKYSAALADKYREELRKIYPYFEMIGVVIS